MKYIVVKASVKYCLNIGKELVKKHLKTVKASLKQRKSTCKTSVKHCLPPRCCYNIVRVSSKSPLITIE